MKKMGANRVMALMLATTTGVVSGCSANNNGDNTQPPARDTLTQATAAPMEQNTATRPAEPAPISEVKPEPPQLTALTGDNRDDWALQVSQMLNQYIEVAIINGDYDGLTRLLSGADSANFISAIKDIAERDEAAEIAYVTQEAECLENGDMTISFRFDVFYSHDYTIPYGGGLFGKIVAAGDYRVTRVTLEEYETYAMSGDGEPIVDATLPVLKGIGIDTQVREVVSLFSVYLDDYRRGSESAGLQSLMKDGAKWVKEENYPDGFLDEIHPSVSVFESFDVAKAGELSNAYYIWVREERDFYSNPAWGTHVYGHILLVQINGASDYCVYRIDSEWSGALDDEIADDGYYDEPQTPSIAQSQPTPQPQAETYHTEYQHVALENCVITELDKLTGRVKYSPRCPVCGKYPDGDTLVYIKTLGAIYTSSFTCKNSKCANWGKRFEVKIKSVVVHVED